jgi:outer membrane protein
MKTKIVVFVTLALSITSYSLQADSLEDIYELALENDAQLKAEEATYLARRETENLGRSQLLPQVTGSYSFQNTDTDTVSDSAIFDGSLPPPIVETKENRDVDNDGYRISLSQAIFDLPAWFSFRSGKEVTREAEAIFAANQQNLIVRVVESYLGVLRAQDNLSASRAQERAFERQLEQTQQRFEVGLIAITDVYEAQAARDLSQVERIADENNLSVALENLSLLTGQIHSNLNVLQENFIANLPDPVDRSSWVDFALANNFQLAASSYREEAARQTSKANTYEHAPKVSGMLEYSDFDSDGSRSIDPADGVPIQPNSSREQQMWQVTMSLPLYSGGA